jgi:hypothetical protein
MPLFYRLLADVVVVVHASYVAFVLFGQAAILVGWPLRWNWIRNLPFRVAHLTAILVVVLEAWFGITCPLTTWENRLRELAGQSAYEGDFIADQVHKVLFYQLPPWIFTAIYTSFGALVVLTLLCVPPRRKVA